MRYTRDDDKSQPAYAQRRKAAFCNALHVYQMVSQYLGGFVKRTYKKMKMTSNKGELNELADNLHMLFYLIHEADAAPDFLQKHHDSSVTEFMDSISTRVQRRDHGGRTVSSLSTALEARLAASATTASADGAEVAQANIERLVGEKIAHKFANQLKYELDGTMDHSKQFFIIGIKVLEDHGDLKAGSYALFEARQPALDSRQGDIDEFLGLLSGTSPTFEKPTQNLIDSFHQLVGDGFQQ
ncbi:hypothetical protein OAN22_02745 [Alphaproteobacteria bacterium]|nr:hypothetical protein [Alphaproteobacteria bacterium]